MAAAAENTLGDVAAALALQRDLRFALVFGSLSAGRETPQSDVDIAVMADHPLSASRRCELMERLAMATGRPVDLVDLRTAGIPIALAALQGRVIACRDRAAYAEWMSRVITDNADFMPLHRRMLKQRRDAWLA
jgi:predicted nucleotidyltransferase